MLRMLLGETQRELASAMQEHFSREYFTVTLEENGQRMLESMRHNQYDVIVLEMALPGLDGPDVIRSYRESGGSVPILLIAGSRSSDELKRGLDAGADAFVSKPFHLGDLSAQVRALLRRPALRSEKVLTLGTIAMDTVAGSVTKNGIPVHLQPMEFKLFQFLLRHPDKVFSAHALFERVWQKDFGGMENTVRTHVRTLRQKIDSEGCTSFITTVRGFGYKVSIPQRLNKLRDLAAVAWLEPVSQAATSSARILEPALIREAVPAC